MLTGEAWRQRLDCGRGTVPWTVADGGLTGPLGQWERMVFLIQEVYLQICV